MAQQSIDFGTAAADDGEQISTAFVKIDENFDELYERFDSGTITASAPMTVTQTWDNAGVTFTGFKVDITDDASAAASLLMDLQVGGTQQLSVVKDGQIRLTERAVSGSTVLRILSENTGIGLDPSIGVNFVHGSVGLLRAAQIGGENALVLGTTGVFGWGNSSGSHDVSALTVKLYRDADDTLAQRRSTNAQAFRWYRTFTDASNYERGALQTAAGAVEVAAETAGTGTDDIDLRLTPAGNGRVDFRNADDAAAAETGTLENAPTAGDPAIWITVKINGTSYAIPAWALP